MQIPDNYCIIVEPVNVYSVLASYYYEEPYNFCLECTYNGPDVIGKQRCDFIKQLLIKIVYNLSLVQEEQEAWKELTQIFPNLINLEGSGLSETEVIYDLCGNVSKIVFEGK